MVVDDFVAVLGRLCFALGPLEHARPFLAPLYAWAGALNTRETAALPWSVRFLFAYLREQFSNEKRAVTIRPISEDLGPAFRGDAKAEGQVVVVGGWECLGGCPPAQA